MVNRYELISTAKETDRIIAKGYYTNNRGEVIKVDCGDSKLYEPDFDYAPIKLEARHNTVLQIVDMTTLMACRELADEGVACLNFASAKNIGGGYLTGSSAQEESLARASTLVKSLKTQNKYYAYNRNLQTNLYSDYIIYSQDVVVFRDDSLKLLDSPYSVNMITAPAVNRGAITKEETCLVDDVMLCRIRKILYVAYINGNEKLVLGAFGCGVFKNDPYTVAKYFKTLLDVEFKDVFKEVIFAIPKGANLTAFMNTWRIK